MVNVHEIDFNFHMNNANYFACMEFGRVDLLVRNGIWRAIYKNGWNLVIQSVTLRWRRELRLFSRYKLVSRIIGWDDKAFFIEQQFVKNQFVHSIAICKMHITKGGNPVKVLQKMNLPSESPPFSEDVKCWIEYDNQSSLRLRPTK